MDIISDFLTTQSASIVTRSIGEFQLDAVTVESHSSTLRLTENPIESGASIADHAVLEPKEITVTGVMVGYEPPRLVSDLMGFDSSAIDSFPLPMEIRAMTKQSEALVSRYISTVDAVVESTSRSMAPFLPDYQGLADDSSQTLDRVGKAYNDLLNLQKKGETITVQTGIKLYENMMIVSIGVTQTSDGSAEFSLTLREIFIVETQKAKGLNVKKSPKKKQMGKTQPKETSKSALKGIFS
ncbi:hypothetical protein LGZ99_21710 [Photorhabdus temperata]|uniref:Photorhabdus luminescens subsp. laumondii TTO1 complete genome segment 10/17 n=1 Tax=Photorhabdus laumondii subsp. laumondii (strain DSM 15139 / CIP 105565 / TT01) TaxID=243265 RepID=Q7N341_PHOLL|nr:MULTISPECIES: hypothetical protein [Photorhabdus]AWK42592.1 hypothetical protein A4R40_14370 [Photorhabdus laumondii subsp. laumondii]AXG47917.1 hypothetical protein PluTT01m_14790 [Photorhabdus laumondii subsp. laumondii]MCT8349743.1 hypothetical protein [Photorhabdus temperata]CAE15255.1 unnamed protein product [Photorhabdus laumondii subsp. laumondii TTO1]